MEAFGLLLGICAALILLGGITIAVRFYSGRLNTLERLYVLVSLFTVPFAIPIALIRLLPPPGPHVPVVFTLIALVRAMLGVPLVLIGVAWIVRALALKRPVAVLVLSTIANGLTYLVLMLPQP